MWVARGFNQDQHQTSTYTLILPPLRVDFSPLLPPLSFFRFGEDGLGGWPPLYMVAVGLDLVSVLTAFGFMLVWSMPSAHPSCAWWLATLCFLAVAEGAAWSRRGQGRCLRQISSGFVEFQVCLDGSEAAVVVRGTKAVQWIWSSRDVRCYCSFFFWERILGGSWLAIDPASRQAATPGADTSPFSAQPPWWEALLQLHGGASCISLPKWLVRRWRGRWPAMESMHWRRPRTWLHFISVF
jgi:diadenosine tetraphosphatase ApaH/serine/threonine PP2A family protein phosphatase